MRDLGTDLDSGDGDGGNADGGSDRSYPTFDLLRALVTLGDGPHQPHHVAQVIGVTPRTASRLLRAAEARQIVRRLGHGQYQLAIEGHTQPLWPSQSPPEALRRLTQATGGGPSALFTPSTVTGRRILVAQELGLYERAFQRPAAVAAYREADLSVDAAGAVILAGLDQPRRELAAHLRPVRDRNLATSRSPFSGWDMTAAAVFSGSVPTGAVAVLMRRAAVARVSHAQLVAALQACAAELGRRAVRLSPVGTGDEGRRAS